MPQNWMDVDDLSFNAFGLLERVQLGWLAQSHAPDGEFAGHLALALKANPALEWIARHRAPEIGAWLDQVMRHPDAQAANDPAAVRRAEIAILARLNDWIIYAVDPTYYAVRPFLAWDDRELLDLADFRGKWVIDIGPGTGRQTFTVAPLAAAVWAVEPSGNLRDYLREKARELGCANVYPVDGLITRLPFPDGFADVVMSGHVYGDEPEAELTEVLRVTKPGGDALFVPGNNDVDNAAHAHLVAQGFAWATFEEPGDGLKRKYWRKK